MAFNVRIHGYRGAYQVETIMQKQLQADSDRVLVEPYEFAQLIVVMGATPVASVANPSSAAAPDKTVVLRVEIPDGQAIRYEINPPGRNVSAGNTSPIMSGRDLIFWGIGWTISMVDAASFP